MIDELNQLADKRIKIGSKYQNDHKPVQEQVFSPPPELSTRKIDEMLEGHE